MPTVVRYLLNDALAETGPDHDKLVATGLFVDVAGGARQAEKPGENPVIPDPVAAKPPVAAPQPAAAPPVDAAPPTLKPRTKKTGV